MVLNNGTIQVYTMVNKVKIRLYGYRSRHSINLPSDFVNDSAFPFKPKDELTARIEGDRIIIEKERTNA